MTNELNNDQKRRVQALAAARSVLGAEADSTDLHSLAVYIETGADPWRTVGYMPDTGVEPVDPHTPAEFIVGLTMERDEAREKLTEMNRDRDTLHRENAELNTQLNSLHNRVENLTTDRQRALRERDEARRLLTEVRGQRDRNGAQVHAAIRERNEARRERDDRMPRADVSKMLDGLVEDVVGGSDPYSWWWAGRLGEMVASLKRDKLGELPE